MVKRKKTVFYADYKEWDHFLESAEKKNDHLPEGPKENELTDETEEALVEKSESIESKSRLKVIFLSAAALLLSAILIFIVWSFLIRL